ALGQDEVPIHQRGDCARRVDRQIFGILGLFAGHADGFIGLADPFQDDVTGQGAGAGEIIEFHCEPKVEEGSHPVYTTTAQMAVGPGVDYLTDAFDWMRLLSWTPCALFSWTGIRCRPPNHSRAP